MKLSRNKQPPGTPRRTEAGVGRIGPNALTRVAEALTSGHGAAVCRGVFAAAGLAHHLEAPPRGMVDEQAVAQLHRAMVGALGAAAAGAVSWEAGRLTGEYLLARRIPKLAQRALQLLPRRVAAWVLVRAIARHAWTFAGSGVFSFGFGQGLELRISGGPVCRLVKTGLPACQFYSGTFQRVFAAMLGERVRVVETDCESAGAPGCVFRVTWE